MKPVDLDGADYGGTYKLVGGRVCLDLINTVSWPGRDREHDWLSSPANLDRWCDANSLPPGPAATPEDLDAARALRSELATAIGPLASGRRPLLSAVERLNDRLAACLPRRRIDPASFVWTWEPSRTATDRLDPVILDAANLVTATRHERLRRCDGCDWLFEDLSRNGRRRWCDMADCGSRAKSRDYYRRSKASTAHECLD